MKDWKGGLRQFDPIKFENTVKSQKFPFFSTINSKLSDGRNSFRNDDISRANETMNGRSSQVDINEDAE